MNPSFRAFTQADIPLYKQWAKVPHVRDTWFRDGYQTVDDHINQALSRDYEFPFIIEIDRTAIGYICICDLEAYGQPCMVDDPEETFCMDIFIGERSYIGRGIGPAVIKALCNYLFKSHSMRRIVTDPAKSNQRAIQCYCRVGFQFLKEHNDGVDTLYVMELQRPNS